MFLTTINKNTPKEKERFDEQYGHIRRYGPELKEIIESSGFKTEVFHPIKGDYYYSCKPDVSEFNCYEDVLDINQKGEGWLYLGRKWDG